LAKKIFEILFFRYSRKPVCSFSFQFSVETLANKEKRQFFPFLANPISTLIKAKQKTQLALFHLFQRNTETSTGLRKTKTGQ